MDGDAGSGWIGRSESRIKRWGVGSERKKEDTGQGRGGRRLDGARRSENCKSWGEGKGEDEKRSGRKETEKLRRLR